MVGVAGSPATKPAPRTLAEKVWDAHIVRAASGEPDLLYIDLHLVHEVTSPQAFDGLRLAGRPVRRPELTLATTTGARERGLILLSCGLYGNVVRILVPLVASDEELDRGLDILEESLVDACTGNT